MFLLDSPLADRVKWNKERKAYTIGKKQVKDAQLYKIVRSEVSKTEQKFEKLANRLISGNISFEQWQNSMANLTRRSHVNMTRLGRGGKDNTFANHYLKTGNDLRTIHYPALRQFAQNIADGKLSEKQIIARAKLYGSATKNSFEVARLSLYEDSISTMGRRRLGACKDHCADCIAYASQGWLPIASVIPPGVNCQCRMNCCCSIEIDEKKPSRNNS